MTRYAPAAPSVGLDLLQCKGSSDCDHQVYGLLLGMESAHKAPADWIRGW